MEGLNGKIPCGAASANVAVTAGLEATIGAFVEIGTDSKKIYGPEEMSPVGIAHLKKNIYSGNWTIKDSSAFACKDSDNDASSRQATSSSND